MTYYPNDASDLYRWLLAAYAAGQADALEQTIELPGDDRAIVDIVRADYRRRTEHTAIVAPLPSWLEVLIERGEEVAR